MLKKGTEKKYEQPYSGPYPIIQVNDNGTVRLQMGAIADTVNIHRIEPFKDTPISRHGGECNRPVHRTGQDSGIGPRRSSRPKKKPN